MIDRTRLEARVLQRLRRHGPSLLGARRRVFRHASGQRTPYLELGRDRGETLVFLHGFSDRPEHFLATAALLRDRYRILAPAMPCFGDGFVDHAAVHTLDAFVRWMGEVVAGIGPERFHLMGNSLGGATALGIASRMPERLASLTLVDAGGVKLPGVSCVFDGYGEGPNPFEVRSREDFDAFLRRVAARPNPVLGLFANALYEEARANADWYVRLGRELGASVGEFHRAGRDAFVDLASVRVPTLVVWGEHDTLFPLAIGEHLARTIPEARLVTMRGIGHVPHLEDPRGLARAFQRFASELPG